jgi:3-methyladenine DNA glycosylase/8-oxoguanine DNA glycosylase
MAEKSTHAFDHGAAVAHITKGDPHFTSLIGKCVKFQLNIDDDQSPYESLLQAIAHQSIAGKAAAIIFGRIKALGSNGRIPTPEEILQVPEQKLREAGFSAAKVAAARDLAQKTIDGIVPSFDQAQKMSDEELVERLISVRGIGAWTVEMFLIFRLGRPDVLPIHDYGVQKGFALTYRKRRIPKPKELLKFGERWRPYRTVASWYLWRAVDVAGKDARKMTKHSGKPAKKRVKIKKRIIVIKRKLAKRKPSKKSS